MSRLKVTWIGKKELEQAFSKALAQSASKTQTVIKNTTEEAKQIARSHAPFDTGELKNNIRTSYGLNRGIITAAAGYSGYQEYGTRYQPGKPFMRPMAKAIVPVMKERLEDVAKGAFQ